VHGAEQSTGDRSVRIGITTGPDSVYDSFFQAGGVE
jgi:hypothetical protein